MKKVLIVEDELPLLNVYQERLQQEGYAILTASTGPAALALATHEAPDAILLDIMIPGDMNGFDVLEQLKRRENLKAIPVIVLTNLDGEEQSALAAGASDYFVKANTTLGTVAEKLKRLTGGTP